MKRIISITINEALLERVDEQAQREGRSRSNLIEMAARNRLSEALASLRELVPYTGMVADWLSSSADEEVEARAERVAAKIKDALGGEAGRAHT
jgi:metal-responsive CopG/Arc/MetJ family transcriptional regulator